MTKRLATLLVAAFLLALVAIGVNTGMAGAADSTTTGYSDGVTYQGELNWGAPSNLHIAENGDACIDPPVWVYVTIHVIVNGIESPELTQVFPYEHNEPGYVCVPFPLPECPTDDDDPQDITWAAYGTWNIGEGRSNEIGGVIDCTPEIPVPPVVPPVELAPPIVPVVAQIDPAPVACEVGKTCLAATGVGSFTWLEVFAGIVMVASGLLIGRIVQMSRRPSRRGLYRGNQ